METLSIGNYIYYKQKIGKGSYSTVYKGYNKFNNKEVAIKRLKYDNLNEKNKLLINRETELMKTFNHKNIVKLYDILFDDNDSKYIYMVLEYCHKGDLAKFLNKRT